MRDGGGGPGEAATVGRLREVSGPSRAGVYRDVQLAARLDPEAAESLRGTAVAGRRGDLERLSGQPARVQRERRRASATPGRPSRRRCPLRIGRGGRRAVRATTSRR